jgi:superfamily II DNA helicase RecQ
MPFEIFHIPACGDREMAAELNGFLAGHKILSVERKLVESGAYAYWSFCVEYLEGTSKSAVKNLRMGKKVDYREILDEGSFRRFAAMRQKRKELAEAQNVPAFAIFTNEELAAISRLETFSVEAMEKIEGISAERARKWAPALETSWNGVMLNEETKEGNAG